MGDYQKGMDDYQRRLRRKADQHWDMAGLARQDRDTPDEIRHTKEARRLERELIEYNKLKGDQR